MYQLIYRYCLFYISIDILSLCIYCSETDVFSQFKTFAELDPNDTVHVNRRQQMAVY